MALTQKIIQAASEREKHPGVVRSAVIHNLADIEIFIEHPSSSCGGWTVGVE